MTGIGPAAGAAAKVATDATGKALKSSALETSALLEEAKGSKELQHAAKQRAHRLAVRETFLNKLFAPLARLMNMKADYFEGDQFSQDMARKTAHLDDDEIIAPKPNIAAQAMQGLGYSLDEPDLKEMYLNLLATASTKDLSARAHPAFAEIIKQLTSDEAAALVPVTAPGARSICRIHRAIPGQEGNSVVFNHYLSPTSLGMSEVDPQRVATWVDNWVRLGLVEVAYDRYLTADGVYDWIEEDRLYATLLAQQNALQSAGNDTVPIWGFDKGFISATTFGSEFREAVMSFETPPVTPADQTDDQDADDAGSDDQ